MVLIGIIICTIKCQYEIDNKYIRRQKNDERISLQVGRILPITCRVFEKQMFRCSDYISICTEFLDQSQIKYTNAFGLARGFILFANKWSLT